MLASRKTRALLIAAACSLALPLAGGSAFAEDGPVDGIRNQCLDKAGTWVDFNPESGHARARTNIYSSCMRQHGLRP
jgi:hypothetical protein